MWKDMPSFSGVMAFSHRMKPTLVTADPHQKRQDDVQHSHTSDPFMELPYL